MRKFAIALLGVSMILSLTACGSGDSDLNTGSYSSKPEVQTSAPETQASDDYETSEVDENTIVPVQLDFGEEFSGGVTWAWYYGTSGPRRDLLSKEGIITPQYFRKSNWGEPSEWSPFSNGYAYINYVDTDKDLTQYIIIDKTGNIVSASQLDSSYEIVAGGDGIFLVYQRTENMTESEDKMGIIDKDGNWICEPNDTTLFLSNEVKEKYLESDSHAVNYYYQGDGVFAACYDIDFANWSEYNNYDYVCLYSTYTGASAEYDRSMGIMSNGGTRFGYDKESYSYFDGKSVIVSSDTVYCIDTNFKIKPIIENRPDGDVYYQEGYIFTGEFEEHTESDYSYNVINNGMFYTTDGSIQVDLSQHTLCQDSDLYCFEDNYAAILIEGEDRNSYLSIIDTNGESAFEPIKVGEIGTFSCGVIAAIVNEKTVLLSTTGDTVEIDVSPSHIERIEFSEGFAWCTMEDHYIDTKGNVLNTVLKN